MHLVLVQWDLSRLSGAISRGKAAGTHRAAEKILSKAQKVVPYAEGQLAGSGDVEPTPSGGAMISFSTPYARTQELDDWKHPDPRNPKSQGGRKAHALRDTTLANVELVNSEVSKAIRREMR